MCKKRFKNMRSSCQEAEAERQSGTAHSKETGGSTHGRIERPHERECVVSVR